MHLYWRHGQADLTEAELTCHVFASPVELFIPCCVKMDAKLPDDMVTHWWNGATQPLVGIVPIYAGAQR